MSSMIFNRPAVEQTVSAFDATSRMARLPDRVFPRLRETRMDLRISLETLRDEDCGPL